MLIRSLFLLYFLHFIELLFVVISLLFAKQNFLCLSFHVHGACSPRKRVRLVSYAADFHPFPRGSDIEKASNSGYLKHLYDFFITRKLSFCVLWMISDIFFILKQRLLYKASSVILINGPLPLSKSFQFLGVTFGPILSFATYSKQSADKARNKKESWKS